MSNQEQFNKMGWPQDVIDRFWSKVNYPGNDQDCWLWTAGPYDTPNKKYYGKFKIAPGLDIRSHVFAFQYYYGTFNNTLSVCHSCDNPKCVNPNHLFLGTSQDNKNDSVNKKRHAYGENHGRAILDNETIFKMFERIKNGEFNSTYQVSLEYNISVPCIRKILNRKLWAHITNTISDNDLAAIKKKIQPNELHKNFTKLSKEEAQEIFNRLKNGEKGRDLAREYLMSETAISNIKNGKHWK